MPPFGASLTPGLTGSTFFFCGAIVIDARGNEPGSLGSAGLATVGSVSGGAGSGTGGATGIGAGFASGFGAAGGGGVGGGAAFSAFAGWTGAPSEAATFAASDFLSCACVNAVFVKVTCFSCCIFCSCTSRVASLWALL